MFCLFFLSYALGPDHHAISTSMQYITHSFIWLTLWFNFVQAILNEKKATKRQSNVNIERRVEWMLHWMQSNMYLYFMDIQRTYTDQKITIDIYIYWETKDWLHTNHFPMNYKQLSELETGQIHWSERVWEQNKKEGWIQLVKRANGDQFNLFSLYAIFPPSLFRQKLFIINQFIIYRSSRFCLLAFMHVLFSLARFFPHQLAVVKVI